MRKLVSFKLDPIFRQNFNPLVSCADCGNAIEFRQARIVMTDISEKRKDQAVQEISIDELARNAQTG